MKVNDEDEYNIKQHNDENEGSNEELIKNNGEEEDEKEEKIVDARTLFNRLFGPLEAGSIRGSIFNMIILSLGSGCLSLPKYVGSTSLCFSLVIVVVLGLLVWWTLTLLSYACDYTKNFYYSRLVKEKYGKGFSLFFDFIVMLYVFGVLILYQVIIGEAVYSLFYYKDYATIEIFMKTSFWNTWAWKCGIVYGVGILIIFPLCLIKDVSKLRVASLFGVVTLIGIIILLIYELKSYIQYYNSHTYKEDNPDTHLNIWDLRKGFTIDMDFFQYCGSLYYAYIGAIGAVPIFNTMKNNEIRRVQKVIRRTIIFDIFLFAIIVTVGYLSWPINTPSLIIEREKIVDGPDIPMSIGRIALVLTVIMKLPSNYSALRICLFDLIWGTTEIESKRNFIMSFIVLAICGTVGILYSEISAYIKLIGGICSSIVGFLIPALLYTKINYYSRYNWRNVFILSICLILTMIGFISAGKTLYDMIMGSSKH